MHDEELHPTIKEFKQFINEHPKLIEEVRRNGRGWQEYYEKWSLLDHDDPFWDDYKESSRSDRKKPEIFGKVLEMTENIDAEKVQKQIKQLNHSISALQEMLGQFQRKQNSNPFGNPNNPFNWKRD
ncbi:YlbD family protein [Virgibacillus ihumii]|uniref:YlbD family protein n=1 Tax=Virgibacillus ihumii TaxID=2686091 RepID=UPI00157C69A5|nr:YlbD family protein [Virgibacillus ihumii]